jgi:hypothetical protein
MVDKLSSEQEENSDSLKNRRSSAISDLSKIVSKFGSNVAPVKPIDLMAEDIPQESRISQLEKDMEQKDELISSLKMEIRQKDVEMQNLSNSIRLEYEQKLADYVEKYQREYELRKQLYNQVQELKGFLFYNNN